MKVKITEAKNYGGAFDIDSESYFTRDDLNEFGYEVEDAIKENESLKDMDIVYNGAWVDDTVLTFAAMDKDGNEVEVQEKIDFRKIKIPSDLIKVYLQKIVSKVSNEFLDIYSDYLNEAQQTDNQLKDLQKKHRKTIKKGAQGYFTTLNSGNPEVNMNVFNASANGVSSPVGESLDEALKNTYEVQYLPYRTDNIVTTYIDAYSEKQAVLILRKTTKGIRRIVSILCIKDRSEEEGEQLDLFEDAAGFYKALQRIANNINSKSSDEYTAEVNKQHRCVDVFKGEELINQVYPLQNDLRNIKDYNLIRIYKQEDIQPGDILYVKRPKIREIATYTSNNVYIKDVSNTGNYSIKDLLRKIINEN